MTPSERARLTDLQEFEAECKAAVERALAYAAKHRTTERQKIEAWINDDVQPAETKFIFARPGVKPQLHTVNGVSRTFNEWAKHLGLSIGALAGRRRRLGSFEAAIAEGPSKSRRHPSRPGVSSNLSAIEGTGAGSTAQETPNITFSGNEA